MIERLRDARVANAGIFNARQLTFGIFDQLLHSKRTENNDNNNNNNNNNHNNKKEQGSSPSAQVLFANTIHDVMGIDATPGTSMPASFGHLMGGYDASYYGYLWAEVFSADMYESVFNNQPNSSNNNNNNNNNNSKNIREQMKRFAEAGRKYRKEILEVGGSRDAAESLRAFLGREPVKEPFLRAKGL